MKDLMIGDEINDPSLRSNLELSYPMRNGKVQNWDEMTRLYDYTFGPEKLNVDGRHAKILLTEPPLNDKENRRKMMKLMFERFNFNAVHVSVQAELTLYAQGTFF